MDTRQRVLPVGRLLGTHSLETRPWSFGRTIEANRDIASLGRPLMTALRRTLPNAVVAAIALLCASSWSATSARAQAAPGREMDDHAALFLDGRAFQVTLGAAKSDNATRIKSLDARPLGPAAIVFRAGDKLYVAGAPLPLQSGAAGLAAYVTADEGPPSRIHVEYVPPENPAHQKIYEMIKQRHVLEMVRRVFDPFMLPVDLVIKTVGCDGVSNAWYQRQGNVPTVSLCYEYLQEIRQSMPEEAKTPMGVTMMDAICGQLFFAVAHELGHAMYDIFDVPVFGRQEDAADQFATFMMLQFGGDQAMRLIGGAAYGYHGYIKDLKLKPQVTLPLAAFSSDHGAPEERYFNLICTAYGYDARLFSGEMEKIPPGRASNCKFEYQDLKFAFHTVFWPHLDHAKVKKVVATNWLTSAP